MGSLETAGFRIAGLFASALGFGALVAGAATLPEHVPGRLLVVPRHGVEAGLVKRTLQLSGARLNRQIPALQLHVLDVPEESSEAVLQSLQQSGMFQSVERDYYAHTAAAPSITPNDPSYINQWHLPKISAPQAWAVNTGAASVVIAVIDSGVDSTHPDLSPQLAPGWNFLTNAADTTDVVGHGTAVAGTVAAASNNNTGVAGVTWNSRIMPLVVVDSNEYASYSNIAAAIQYAADHGAQIINISIGGTSSSSVLQNAVDYAWSKNVVIFASAMNNSSSTPNYPAACNHVVAVSATDTNDALAGFSNYGSWITLAAPGNNILTTTMGGGYGYWYGTSFSSPIAAGVAALALAVNPALSPSALVTLLEQNTDDLGTPGFDTSFGWGRVNAYKAVTAAQPPAPLTIAPLAVSLYGGQTQQFAATAAGSATTAVTWSLSPGVGSISSTGIYTAPASVTAQTVTVTATAAGGSTASATITLVPVKVTAFPLTASLNAGQTQQFTAAVTGTSSAVTWSLSPVVGSISSTGLYTAPASVTAQTVTVTATAAGVSASASVTLVPVQIAVTPATASLIVSQTQQFTASVAGTTNTAVTWSLSPAVGSISSTGLYTTPASVSTAQTITVTASGAGGATGSASLTVLPGTVTVSTAFTPIRVNAGGPAYVDTLGQTWAADNSFSSGNTWTTSATVSGSTAPAVYQTCRWGAFSYGFAVPNGSYTVTLKFAEPTLPGVGLRQFNTAINGAAVLTNFDVYTASGGAMRPIDKSFPVTVTNGQIAIQFTAGAANWPMVNGIEILQAQPTFIPIRVNSAGPSYVDSLGQSWSADTGFTGGNTWTNLGAITGTASPTVYQTCRWGAFSYSFTVPNGTYTVNLKFAEISLTGAGQRQFNAAINGASVLTNFDIYAAAGGRMIAIDKPFPVTVTNGQINIQFTAGAANWPLVSGIEILAGATAASSGAIRVHSAGPAYVDSKGQSWSADMDFNGGSLWSTSGAISGTTDPALYQTCRWGVFNYVFPVSNGTYTVNLKFAEISRTAVGQRQFNAALNGAPVLTNFDIIAAAGGAMKAIDKSFTVTVSNGQIIIQFTAGAADLPLINAIEILPSGTVAAVLAPAVRVPVRRGSRSSI